MNLMMYYKWNMIKATILQPYCNQPNDSIYHHDTDKEAQKKVFLESKKNNKNNSPSGIKKVFLVLNLSLILLIFH